MFTQIDFKLFLSQSFFGASENSRKLLAQIPYITYKETKNQKKLV